MQWLWNKFLYEVQVTTPSFTFHCYQVLTLEAKETFI